MSSACGLLSGSAAVHAAAAGSIRTTTSQIESDNGPSSGPLPLSIAQFDARNGCCPAAGCAPNGTRCASTMVSISDRSRHRSSNRYLWLPHTCKLLMFLCAAVHNTEDQGACRPSSFTWITCSRCLLEVRLACDCGTSPTSLACRSIEKAANGLPCHALFHANFRGCSYL